MNIAPFDISFMSMKGGECMQNLNRMTFYLFIFR